MKKTLFYFFFCLGCAVFSQTNSENYILTITYQTETSPLLSVPNSENTISNVTYFDGLNRAKQIINIRGGGNSEDLITPIFYDQFGRINKNYLPLPKLANSGGYYSTNIQADLDTYYTNKYPDDFFQGTSPQQIYSNFYSEKQFDNSPLNRVIEKAYPGYDWRIGSNTIKTDYTSNTLNEVKYYSAQNINDNIVLNFNGFYGENEIFKTINKTENWNQGKLNTNEIFIDKSGKEILKIEYVLSEGLIKKLETYFVYDNKDRLILKLTPKANSELSNLSGGINIEEILNEYAFQYKYDSYNRIISQRTPGSDWEHIVYNDLDQPILTQDGNLRNSDKWLFKKYDIYGREVYSGIYISNNTREQLQNLSDNSTFSNEKMEMLNTTQIDGVQLNYTNRSFPTTGISELHAINYYDRYTHHSELNLPSSVYGTPVQSKASGLLSVSRVRVLGTGDWIVSLYGYDEFGRLLHTSSINEYLNTVDVSNLKLDFTDKVVESTNIHSKENYAPITIKDFYTYDHQNRLLSHKQKIDNEPIQLIASNRYDESGRKIQKSVGGETFINGYTNVTNAQVSEYNAGGRIIKTSSQSSWDSGAKTKGEIINDGGITFTPFQDDKKLRVGLISNNSTFINNNGWDSFDFGIEISSTLNNLGTNIKVIIDGNLSNNTYGFYQADDDFSVERVGNDIIFKHNNVEIERITLANNQLDYTFTGKIGLYDTGAAVMAQLFAPNIDKKLQIVDYQYNLRGWLTSINGGSQVQKKDSDLFKYYISYNNTNESTSTKLYNGNISETFWQTKNQDESIRGYSYNYDALNRILSTESLLGSDFNSINTNNNYNTSNITYDENGNIKSLKRRGLNQNNSSIIWDDLTYTYEGNKLVNILDTASSDEGYKVISTSASNIYSYDLNGNLIEDTNKGITIQYNHLDLPVSILFEQTSAIGDEVQINYVYDAMGEKLSKEISQLGYYQKNKTEYAGSFLYTSSENNSGVYEPELQFFKIPEGYVEPTPLVTNDGRDSKSIKGFDTGTGQTTYSSYNYVFQYSDHLGNIRLSYSDLDKDGAITTSEIIEESHYYPFGLKQTGYNDIITTGGNSFAQQYKFGGKELQDELNLGWYDFGARNYDPSLGRWFNKDPLNQFTSPYLSFGNNPVRYVDPDGQWAIVDDLIAVAIGGVINTVANWENIDSFGDGAAYFGIGGLAGLASVYGTPVAGAAVLGLGNSLYRQQDKDGTIDPTLAFKETLFSAATAGIGARVAPAITPYAGKLFGNSSSLLTTYATDAVVNTTTGVVLGTAQGVMEGQSIPDSFNGSLETIPQSLTISIIGTTGTHFRNKYYTNKSLKESAYTEAVEVSLSKELNQNNGIKIPAEIKYKPVVMTTSSGSLAPSRTYTIYDGTGRLYKFGVTDVKLVRYNQSLLEAGPGATGKYSSPMFKGKAHSTERYLRSLQFKSTGQYSLPGMKYPYPINFDTGLKIKPGLFIEH